MKFRLKVVSAIVVCALLLTAVLWTPVAVAWQPLCYRCVHILFQGHYCTDYGGTHNGCEHLLNGTGCTVLDGPCNWLTIQP